MDMYPCVTGKVWVLSFGSTVSKIWKAAASSKNLRDASTSFTIGGRNLLGLEGLTLFSEG
jgi:hypothetical protein